MRHCTPSDCRVREQLEQMGNIIWNKTAEQFSIEELREIIRDVEVCLSGWGCPLMDRYILEHAEASVL
mgnify:CR=1 FL=1